MSKPSSILESIDRKLIQLNMNQLDMIAKQSATHTMVRQLRVDVNKHDGEIGTLKENYFKKMGGWQMLLIIGSALLSVGAIVATFLN